jgi:hypothetical protein
MQLIIGTVMFALSFHAERLIQDVRFQVHLHHGVLTTISAYGQHLLSIGGIYWIGFLLGHARFVKFCFHDYRR